MPSFLGLDFIYPIIIQSNIGLRTRDGRNLRVTGADIGAQRWQFSVTLQPQVGPTNGLGMLAAHRARHSRLNSFEIECPQVVD